MPTIKQEIAKGVFWIAVARYSGIFISLAITAVLARNVSPAAFGTMAVATVIMAFLDIFTEFGIGPAVIQFKDLTRRDLSSLFMIGGGIGIVLGVALFLCAPVVARFYDDMTLVPVVRLLCICLLFNSLNVVPNGLMLKAKRFRTVALRTLSFQLLCGCVAVWGCTAWMGHIRTDCYSHSDIGRGVHRELCELPVVAVSGHRLFSAPKSMGIFGLSIHVFVCQLFFPKS